MDTVTTWPFLAIFSPEYQGSDPAPLENAPPCSQTTTGRLPRVSRGAQIFRVRQSSSCGNSKSPMAAAKRDLFCGEMQEFRVARSEEHTSELQSLMRISYSVFCL